MKIKTYALKSKEIAVHLIHRPLKSHILFYIEYHLKIDLTLDHQYLKIHMHHGCTVRVDTDSSHELHSEFHQQEHKRSSIGSRPLPLLFHLPVSTAKE